MQYILVKQVDGSILKSGFCIESDIEGIEAATPGTTVIGWEGDVDDQTQIYNFDLHALEHSPKLAKVKLEEDRANLILRQKTQIQAKLKSSDYTQLADVPLSNDDQRAWKAYRKELRDLDPEAADFELPTPPGE